MRWKRWLAAVALLLALVSLEDAHAQKSRTIEMIIPFPAGAAST